MCLWHYELKMTPQESQNKRKESITSTKQALKASEYCLWFVFLAKGSRLFTFSIVEFGVFSKCWLLQQFPHFTFGFLSFNSFLLNICSYALWKQIEISHGCS